MTFVTEGDDIERHGIGLFHLMATCSHPSFELVGGIGRQKAGDDNPHVTGDRRPRSKEYLKAWAVTGSQ